MRQVILRLLGVVLVLLGAQFAVAGDQGSVLSDGTVGFKVGSSELTEASERVLDRLAALLKRRRDLDPIELVGHADDRGLERTNRALSLRRAEVVKRALIGRGIRARRILVRGAGSAEPVSRADTDQARELNRRVEVWITPQKPVAEVTEVQRIVRSREAAAPKWRAARVGQSLRRLARVRTGQSSASEVEFRSKDTVQLGPEALVVIYDTPRRGRASKADVDDVAVESGTIFASMAAKDRALRVRTKPSRVKVRSKRTRIDVRRRRRARRPKAATKTSTVAKQVSTVSVFEGRSEVSARGERVTVREGFGTRVTEGQAPEPPRPLPVAPSWITRDPYVTYAGHPLDLAWTDVAGVDQVEVQLGRHDDPKVERPHRLWRVKGGRTRGGAAQVGLHHLRLVGVDDRDVSGAPGRTLRLVALPRPTDPRGQPVSVTGGRLRLRRPGEVRWPAAGALTVSSTTSSTTPLRAALVRPGRHLVPATLHAGAVQVERSLEVWVDTATLTAQVSLPKVVDGVSRTEIIFEVSTGAGPVEGLTWVGGTVPMPTSRLAARSGEPKPLPDCRCGAPPKAAHAEPLGNGRYRWVSTQALPALTSSVTVRLFEPRGRLAVELPIAVVPGGSQAQTVKAAPRARRGGLFGGLRVGALLSHADAPTAELSAELGYRLELGGPLELDLSVEGGWLRREIAGAGLHAVPLLGRAALGYDLGAPRLYAGAGGGIRVLSPGGDVGPAAAGFVGVGYRFARSEILLEAAFRYAGDAPGTSEGLAGLAVVLGYRLGTFYLP